MIKSIKSFMSDNILNDSAFRIVYFVNLFLCSIVLLDIVSVFIDAVIMIWALFILYDKYKRKVLNVKYVNLILLFLIFSVVTAVLHVSIGFPVNFFAGLVLTYHATICFFIFYGMYLGNDTRKIKKEAIFIFKTIVILTAFFTIVSFAIMLFKDSFNFGWDMPIIEKYEHVVGIVKDQNSARFTGIYTNPNILAFCSVVSTVFFHMLYRSEEFLNCKKRWIRILLAVLLISLNLSALILSDSIASFLFLVIYAALWLFYKLMVENKTFSIKSLLKKGILFLLVSIILIFGLFSIRSCIQNGASNIIDDIYSIISNNQEKKEIDEDIHFGRPNHDIRDGSGRRRLLKQGMVLFSKHPILGIGNANIIEYGKIYFETGIAFPNLHNGYLSILICNGLVGFVLFILFLASVLLKLLKFLLKKSRSLKKNIFANLFIAILSYLVFALFEKTMLSEINFMGLFFWLILGYAVSYVYSYGEYGCGEMINLRKMLKK